MTDAFTFDPDITFTPDHKLVVTGTADASVSKIEILSRQTDADFGSATISNGTWSFTQDIPPGNGPDISSHSFRAQVTTTSGTTIYADTALGISDVTGNPYSFIEEDIGGETPAPFRCYSHQDKLESHGNIQPTGTSTQTGNAIDNVTQTGDQANTHFVFWQTDDTLEPTDFHQTITNFHASGQQHDTVLLPHADFANMAALLRDTTMSGGNAVIHDPNSTSSLTLMGVTKTEMKAHPSDFSFHGSGRLSGTSHD